MIKHSHVDQKFVGFQEKIQCDVFFSHKDITALRWISEINRILAPYQEYVVINIHEVESDHAREMQISTDSVVINKERIEFYEVNKTLFELATNFINELRESENAVIVSE